ncbi:hypothetical protein SLE2022_271980 [Rubroshorea leprosula]
MADEQQKRDFVLNTPTSEPPPGSRRPDTNFIDDDNEYFKSLPPGYRFKPFDEELIIHYLNNKIHDKPLPRNKIKEVNLYKHNPETLAGKFPLYEEKEWYFFTPRDRKYPNGGRPKRDTGDGYWKATGADKKIYNDDSRKIEIGYRKALVFYEGKAPNGVKTDWIMHEYRASGAPSPKNKETKPMRLDDVILCRLYKKVDSKSGRNKQKDVPVEPDDQDEQQSDNENANHQTTETVDFSRELPYEEGPSNIPLLQPKTEYPFSGGSSYNTYGGSNFSMSSNFQNSRHSTPDYVNGYPVPSFTGHHDNGTLHEDLQSFCTTQGGNDVMHDMFQDIPSTSIRQDAFTQNVSSFVPQSENKYPMMINGNCQHDFPAPCPQRTMTAPAAALALPYNVSPSAPPQYVLRRDSKTGYRDFKKMRACINLYP